jgi:hypothetical protein
MKMALRRWWVAGIAAGLFTVLTGCATTGEVGVSYGADYYDPYGYDYTYWQPGYYVAPPRRDRDDRDRRDREGRGGREEVRESRDNRETREVAPRAESRPPQPAYRPAPPSRPAPSIPSRPRSEPRPH